MASDLFIKVLEAPRKGNIQVRRKIGDIQKPRVSLFGQMGYRKQFILLIFLFFLYAQVISMFYLHHYITKLQISL